MLTKLLLVCLGLAIPSMGASLPFIIGGSEVGSMSEYPHTCAMIFVGLYEIQCGTSIISKDWLVTAAHCVDGYGANMPRYFTLRCGSLHWENGTEYHMSTIVRHEDYNKGSGVLPNDIALLKVSTPIDLSSPNMKAISLATTDQVGNPDCYITGWGLTHRTGTVPKQLMVAKINVKTNAYCKGRVGDGKINEGHVCALDDNFERGPCEGDSGGPLVCKVNGQLQLVGVISWEINGCPEDHPSVCSRISYFRAWITEKTGVY